MQLWSRLGLALTLGVVFVSTAATARAQVVEEVSWTVQDPEHGLMQDIAREVIERANAWLTRNDPYETTARLDDPMRITVVGEYATDGAVHYRLRRLTMGSVVLDSEFDQFLDSATIRRLVRRDYYWRDEQVVSDDGEHTRIAERMRQRQREERYHQAFESDPAERVVLSLRRSTVPLPALDGAEAFAALGYESVGLPAFSFARMRVGVHYGNAEIWGELPLPIGSSDNILAARGSAGTFGFGMAIETRDVGGAISWGDPSWTAGGDASATPLTIDRTALVYWISPAIELTGPGDLLRAKFGGGYLSASPLESESGGTAELPADSRLAAFARGEWVTLDDAGQITRSITVGLFGPSICIGVRQMILPWLGIDVTYARHDVIGPRASYLPAQSILLSPVIMFDR